MTPQKPLLKGNLTDHLANERTFLAWLRTAMAIMAFGFVVVKFSLFVRQISYALSNKAPVLPGKGYSGFIGIALVALGAVLAVLSYVRYKNIEHYITDQRRYPSSLPILLLTASIVVISVLLVVYLYPSLR